jgi:hypothetical protein
MKYSTHNKYFLAVGLICSIALFSCRKKDERYEGSYIGTERHTYLDSGATSYSIDTTYYQEVEVTYDNAVFPRRKCYTFTKLVDYQYVCTISKKSIVDHEYTDGYAGAYLKFSGDSLYIYSSNFSDQFDNWDTQTWEFKGKRN